MKKIWNRFTAWLSGWPESKAKRVREEDLLFQKHEQMIRKNNKNASIIFTLSPVPLKATFRNMSCTVANSVSKAILRVALDEIFNKYTKDKKIICKRKISTFRI